MSKAQIIDDLPRLSVDERREILDKIHEIDYGGWLANDLSPEETALIDQRLAAHQQNAAAAILWAEAKTRLVKRFDE